MEPEKVRLIVEVDPMDIRATIIQNMSLDDFFDMVCDYDASVTDWDFAMKVYLHFKGVMRDMKNHLGKEEYKRIKKNTKKEISGEIL